MRPRREDEDEDEDEDEETMNTGGGTGRERCQWARGRVGARSGWAHEETAQVCPLDGEQAPAWCCCSRCNLDSGMPMSVGNHEASTSRAART